MSEVFSIQGVKEPFVLFSLPHLSALIAILMLCTGLFIFRKKLRGSKSRKTIRWTLACIIVIQLVIIYGWHIYSGILSLPRSLPLQLCDMSLFLSIPMLIIRSKKLYMLLYFWGLGGAMQALLTPDISVFGFPHIVFFQFFISHGCLILACLYMTFVEEYRPTFKSVFAVLGFTNLYAGLVAIVDLATGGNYLFLCTKPMGASIIDFLGPWPIYILSLELVALTLFMILYLPFLISDLIHAARSNLSTRTLDR